MPQQLGADGHVHAFALEQVSRTAANSLEEDYGEIPDDFLGRPCIVCPRNTELLTPCFHAQIQSCAR
jgi:hypothetical protein